MVEPLSFDELGIGGIVMGILGGLALFLFGMDEMSNALRLVAGDRLKRVLGTLTTNRFTGAIAGAFVTSVIQSSSVTTVLVVGFVSAGIMTLSQSVGVIMGANIGTTITAQLIAFKVTQYALLLVAIGFALSFSFRARRKKLYGEILMGLGLIFFGMQIMSEATNPLRDFQAFQDLMRQMDRPLYGIAAAAVFTALVQSSSATTGLVIALSLQGHISLEAGIALIFGANIGTCITAMLAAIGKPREAVRAAVIHVLFNVGGVVIWFAFIPHLASIVSWISPSHPELTGMARLAAETPRQIANAHSVFNLTNTLVFIWLTTPLADLAKRLVPERAASGLAEGQPRYLDAMFLQSPAIALDLARKEILRLGGFALRMVHHALHPVLRGSEFELDELQRMDEPVDVLHGEIVQYLGRLSQSDITRNQSTLLQNLLSVANYLENIGDMIETNLVEAGRERFRHNAVISDPTYRALERLHDKACWAVGKALQTLVAEDRQSAEAVIAAKSEINHAADAASSHLLRRLTVAEPKRMETFRIETDIIENYRRIYYFAKRIAKIDTGEPNSKNPPEPTGGVPSEASA